MTNRSLLRVYIDETGDRGVGATSSPFFAFAAVLVPEESDRLLRAAVSKLRRDLKVPPGAALHWNRHVKLYARRQHVATTLAAVPDLMIIYVLVEKAALPAGSGMSTDHVIFYNYAAGFVMERALLAAKEWPGGSRDAKVLFGHVRGFDHTGTLRYFRRKRQQGAPWVPWHLLRGDPSWDGQASWDGLQAADQYAGMLSAAIVPDSFGGFEPVHLIACRAQVRRRSPHGTSWGYGFKFLGNEATITGLPWWPTGGL